jgi:hypothetical protein
MTHARELDQSAQQQLVPIQVRVGSFAHESAQVQNPGGGTLAAIAPAQLPLTHWTPSGQRTPQPPQLRMSDIKLTQPSVPQHDCPRLHLSPLGGQPQLPPRQIVPSGQMVPQLPQLRGSREVSPQPRSTALALCPA